MRDTQCERACNWGCQHRGVNTRSQNSLVISLRCPLKSSNITKHLQSNYVCFFFFSSPHFYSLSAPPTFRLRYQLWTEGEITPTTRKEGKHADETARRETNTGKGDRCVLTVGMSATLWVIRKEIPLLLLSPSPTSCLSGVRSWSTSCRGVGTRPKTHHP